MLPSRPAVSWAAEVTVDETTHMAEAVALARRALDDDAGGPFGAVVVRGGRVVGRGRNEVVARHDPTAHAEVLAVRDACACLGTFDLTGCTVYASSEPCPMCLGALLWARVDRVVYAVDRAGAARAGFDDARFYDAICARAEPGPLALEHRPDAEAVRVLEAWTRRPDRPIY